MLCQSVLTKHSRSFLDTDTRCDQMLLAVGLDLVSGFRDLGTVCTVVVLWLADFEIEVHRCTPSRSTHNKINRLLHTRTNDGPWLHTHGHWTNNIYYRSSP